MFLSDNGASAEVMVRGDGHDPNAPPGSWRSHLCLGPGWSTVANTPFRKHKTWNHEGGTATPLIVHWPAGIPERERGTLRRAPGHVIDIAPTLLDLAGAPPINHSPGTSLTSIFSADREWRHPAPLWWHHNGHRALRQDNWKLVATNKGEWELYDLATDRAETNDLAAAVPERASAMAAQWKDMAKEFQDHLGK